MLVIRDYVLSLARNGFERFYFLNGHGGNIATTQAAFSEIYAETSLNPGWGRPHIRCKLANWYGFQPVSALCRSEEHTSELQSLMRISYAVFCLQKKKKLIHTHNPRLIKLKHKSKSTITSYLHMKTTTRTHTNDHREPHKRS